MHKMQDGIWPREHQVPEATDLSYSCEQSAISKIQRRMLPSQGGDLETSVFSTVVKCPLLYI